MKIGLLGGTFNPVHNGHLSLANQLVDLGYLDRVLFVVSARPPHKDAPEVSDEARLLMVKLALSDSDSILPCDIELKREGKSYTADTVAEISRLYPEDEIYFITGADMFTDIPFWYKPETIFKTVKFLVADRENAFSDASYKAEADRIKEKYNADVTFINIDTPDISSSMIRENPEKYKDELDGRVYEYIIANGLYKKEKKTLEQKILDILPKKLGEKRLKHTMGVARCARMLAFRFGENPDKAYIAGLLHDIEKEDSIGNMLRLLKDLNLDSEMKESRALLHGPAGAEYAKQTFLVEDDIYYACFYHTIGNENMTTLEKIVYLADYIEENRCQEGVNFVRETAKTSLDRAVLLAMNNTISYLEKKGMKIYKKTVDARNYLLKSIEKYGTIN